MHQSFITLSAFSPEQLSALIDRTIAEKPSFQQGGTSDVLKGKTLAMIFEKPSLRTRVSFEVGMQQLGGSSMYLDNAQIGIGKREPLRDIARVLSRMCGGIMGRTFRHDMMEELAEWSDVPVINGLTDYSHPCQAMADLVTVREHFGTLEGLTLTFVGDGNNVARSLAVGCAKLGLRFVLASPPGYELSEEFLETLLDEYPNADCQSLHEPGQAVRQADVIYTDTWVSMGQEEEKLKRAEIFRSYQVNEALLAMAPSQAIVLHCLPAYRDMEITDAAFERHAGTIFAQAENRLHFQRTLLEVLMGEGGIA